jgi:secondary thiamine-phosphate synthase enzyme
MLCPCIYTALPSGRQSNIPYRKRHDAVEEKAVSNNTYDFWQKQMVLPPFKRGFHLIQSEIDTLTDKMPPFQQGIFHIFIQHTSASLSISENACDDVAKDMEIWFTQHIPDSTDLYQHNMEGPDDMPGHIKNVLLGSSVTLPLHNGKLALGRWQGVFLCEHRDQAPQRSLICTAHGLL